MGGSGEGEGGEMGGVGREVCSGQGFLRAFWFQARRRRAPPSHWPPSDSADVDWPGGWGGAGTCQPQSAGPNLRP